MPRTILELAGKFFDEKRAGNRKPPQVLENNFLLVMPGKLYINSIDT